MDKRRLIAMPFGIRFSSARFPLRYDLTYYFLCTMLHIAGTSLIDWSATRLCRKSIKLGKWRRDLFRQETSNIARPSQFEIINAQLDGLPKIAMVMEMKPENFFHLPSNSFYSICQVHQSQIQKIMVFFRTASGFS